MLDTAKLISKSPALKDRPKFKLPLSGRQRNTCARTTGFIAGAALKTFLLAAACLSWPLTSLSFIELPRTLDLSVPGAADQILLNADANDTRISGQQLAQSLATGDVNGDGIKDILIGVPSGQGPDNRRQTAGEVLIFFGRAGTNAGTIIRDAAMPAPPAGLGADIIIYGPTRGLLGISVAAADVNGDGVDDILIGAQGATKPSIGGARAVPTAGAVFVVLGNADLARKSRIDLGVDDGAAADLRIFGPHLASLAGFAVAAGDLNGDGIADVIIGSPGANKAGSARAYGAAYVFFGGAELVGLRDLAAAPSSAMGPDVAVFGAEASSPISGDQLGAGLAVGDLNGDRVSDLIVSAPLADGPDNQRREAGEIYVFFGGSDLTKGTTVDLAQTNAPLTVHGATSSDQLGLAIALGDVNGDGTNDLIMGSRGRVITAGENVGATYVIFGNQMLAGQPIRDLNQTAPPIATGADIFISGPARRGFLGFSVASGDINGDQIGDLIIGANHANNPSDIETGVVYIFNGRPGLASGTMLDAAAPSPPQGANVVVLGVEQGDELGFSVAAGDVNADGIADLLMSAPGGDGPNNSRSGAGETYVVFGER